jgi:hypothetical protein
VRKVLTASGLAIGIILAIMAYALGHDLADGLRFSRSTDSWTVWAAGLFVGGLFLVLMELARDWLFGPDEPWRGRPRRLRRVAIAALVIAIVAAAIAILSR